MPKTFTGKDGELRIYDRGTGGTTHYLKILFCDMNLTGPIARPKVDENLVLNRQTFDSDSHYVEGSDEAILAPLPLTFSCRADDQTHTKALHTWLSGGTMIPNVKGATSTIYSWKGESSLTTGGTSLPDFADSSKSAYRVEVLWDGTTNDYGLRWEEVYFPPNEQAITEAPENVILGINGQVYGGITRITAFSAGTNFV